ncbi:hypothetical protein BGZ81_010938 [Podila clonocystis]|nr:hypothetical protein BGZ81_010938 [Podila clonocystis]
MTSTEGHLTELPAGFRYVSTTRQRPPLTDQEHAAMEKPKVLIVGAGLGGITLGMLLERAGIPFDIIERNAQIAKPMVLAHSYDNNMKVTQVTDWSVRDTLYGNDGGDKSFVVARPMLCNLILRQIPAHKIHIGKCVISLKQNKYVMIRCTDNETYHGDILVGADGAYSSIRQSLYKELKDQKLLPPSDDGRVALTTRENTICWSVIQHLDKSAAKDNDAFRNSEWGPEASEAMCKEIGHLRIPGGNGNLTLKDIFDRTPKSLISKVMLEDMVFDTWYDRRTACHKMHPAAGQGAVNAMQDAISLANVIASLPSKEMDEITECFKVYKSERYPPALAAFNMSHILSKSFERKNK